MLGGAAKRRRRKTALAGWRTSPSCDRQQLGNLSTLLDLTPTSFRFITLMRSRPSFRDSICWSAAFLREALSAWWTRIFIACVKKTGGRGCSGKDNVRGVGYRFDMLGDENVTLSLALDCGRILALAIGSGDGYRHL